MILYQSPLEPQSLSSDPPPHEGQGSPPEQELVGIQRFVSRGDHRITEVWLFNGVLDHKPWSP